MKITEATFFSSLLLAALFGASFGYAANMQSKYDRDDWRHWSDLDKDGLNTREEVLIRDGCDDGLCVCPYSGKIIHGDRYTHSDHKLSLKEAHDAGGWKWSARKREVFANDLENLIAVDGVTNQQKGSRDETEWLPTVDPCGYAKGRLDMRHKYLLPMSAMVCMKIVEVCSDDAQERAPLIEQ